ncbi:hypothetical protein GCM10029978_023280 [Actinoallomurus acanthiterrae]
MRVVVTGAAGFIGGHVAEAMARAGHEVLAVDALHRSAAPDAARDTWACLADRAGVTLVETDLATDDLTKLADADAVVHLAPARSAHVLGRRSRRRRTRQRHRDPAAAHRLPGRGARPPPTCGDRVELVGVRFRRCPPAP